MTVPAGKTSGTFCPAQPVATMMNQSAEANSIDESLIHLKRITSRVVNLPPMPVTAARALQMTQDPMTTARDLQVIISQDQALSARILRIVNSAVYYFRQEVSTVSHAVALLGMETIRSIIMAASVQQAMQVGLRMGNDLGTKLMADHSWAAAIASRLIAQRVKYAMPEEALICGLMHDIGKAVLYQAMPVEYLEILSSVYRREATFHESEMGIWGFSHAHVGALLAGKWNFPRQLSEAIGYHHNPLSAPNFRQLACIISLSNRMMISLEIGFERNKALMLRSLPEFDFLRLAQSDLDAIIPEVQASGAQMSDFISI